MSRENKRENGADTFWSIIGKTPEKPKAKASMRIEQKKVAPIKTIIKTK